MKVLLFEISYKKKKELFHHIQFFLDVPVDLGIRTLGIAFSP